MNGHNLAPSPIYAIEYVPEYLQLDIPMIFKSLTTIQPYFANISSLRKQ
ncbi:hypothetical protein BN1221_03090c [Brenneria goodwinii]|uniref:Uncharacterized protein n=1 Tax=Brenneria goodwinii TaxID=1109412 RepID=A0A0G4JXL6_9GAMM|nr:hypothetical protein BN1221_03090c [Brenneria goodwinii]